MFCKNCGKGIADNSSFCPHCGTSTVQDMPHAARILDTPTDPQIPEKREKIKKKILAAVIIIITALLIVGLIGGYLILQNVSLSPEEKYCVEAVQQLRSNLKNPESLQIHEIKYYDGELDDAIITAWNVIFTETPDRVVFIDYSAQNGLGGLNRNKGGYACNMFFNGNTESGDTAVQLAQTTFKLLSAAYWDDATTINVEKILKAEGYK